MGFDLIKLPLFTRYSESQVWANSVDPDQMPRSAASDLGLHLFATHTEILHTLIGSKVESKGVNI